MGNRASTPNSSSESSSLPHHSFSRSRENDHVDVNRMALLDAFMSAGLRYSNSEGSNHTRDSTTSSLPHQHFQSRDALHQLPSMSQYDSSHNEALNTSSTGRGSRRSRVRMSNLRQDLSSARTSSLTDSPTSTPPQRVSGNGSSVDAGTPSDSSYTGSVDADDISSALSIAMNMLQRGRMGYSFHDDDQDTSVAGFSGSNESSGPGRSRYLYRLLRDIGFRIPFDFTGVRKCPICSKEVPDEDYEVHYVICLTKPRLEYIEEALTEDKGECPICLDDMLSGSKVARLPCVCVYHTECLELWFKKNRNCPVHPEEDE